MKLFKWSMLTLVAVTCFTSCDDDEFNPAGSTIAFAGSSTVNENDGELEITITRESGAGLLELTFELSGTATAGEDYLLPESNTVFLPVNGETMITIPLIDDDEVEGDETIIITLIEENLELVVTLADDDTFPYEEGLLVSNEGPFNNGFGTVSFINNLFTEIDNDIYQDVNSDNLGNIVNSIGFNEDDAYIVANVSNRITVVNRFTFAESARIETGLENPRYFEAVNGKGYVSNWGDPFVTTDDYIAVIDLATNTVVNTIPVGEGPERIITNGNRLYVALQGGFGFNNQVVVIDPNTDTVEEEITVGDVPESMAFNAAGDLWVLSQGNPSFSDNETSGQFDRIDTATQTVVETTAYTALEHPSYLNIVEDELFYYLDSALYKASAVDFNIPAAAAFSLPLLYNMFLPDNRTLIGCDAGDFASPGNIVVFDAITGDALTSVEVGVIPGNVYINEQ